jgi:(p)ppGpp synthase/HD superfamily hydrolase
MTQSSKEQQAQAFAIKAHGSQQYGTEPYSYHLEMVRNILVEFGYTSEDYMCAAWLHDTLEDTDTTKAEVEELFGSVIADLAFAVSGFGHNRKARNANILNKLSQNTKAIPIKLADRLANCRNSTDSKFLSMYKKEYPAFKSALQRLTGFGEAFMWIELDELLK